MDESFCIRQTNHGHINLNIKWQDLSSDDQKKNPATTHLISYDHGPISFEIYGSSIIRDTKCFEDHSLPANSQNTSFTATSIIWSAVSLQVARCTTCVMPSRQSLKQFQTWPPSLLIKYGNWKLALCPFAIGFVGFNDTVYKTYAQQPVP